MADTMPTAPQTIPEMFQVWLTARNRDVRGMTDEEADVGQDVYAEMQSMIIAAEPQSPADVAIMFIVDTDFTGSDFSTIFENRMFELAGVTEEMSEGWRAAQ